MERRKKKVELQVSRAWNHWKHSVTSLRWTIPAACCELSVSGAVRDMWTSLCFPPSTRRQRHPAASRALLFKVVSAAHKYISESSLRGGYQSSICVCLLCDFGWTLLKATASFLSAAIKTHQGFSERLRSAGNILFMGGWGGSGQISELWKWSVHPSPRGGNILVLQRPHTYRNIHMCQATLTHRVYS